MRSVSLSPKTIMTASVVAAVVLMGLLPVNSVATAASGNASISGAYLGAYVQPEGWSKTDQQAAVTNLESALGRKLNVDNYYYGWGVGFASWRLNWDVQNGRTPMVSWAGTDLGQIVNGSQDALIRTRADDLRTLGAPVLLRWFWEMDADKNITQISSPSQYITAWKRLHDIFDQQGATNVEWVWCPNAYAFSTGEAQTYYPGDAYVDWICADGYNWAPTRAGAAWSSFSNIFSSFYSWGAPKAPPLMVGETGVLERDAGEKAAWITAMANSVKTSYPEIKALLYFDAYASANFAGMYDWRLTSSASSMADIKKLGADPYFDPSALGSDISPPTTPSGLEANVVDQSRIDLSWAPSTDDMGITRYEVVRNGAVIASDLTEPAYPDTALTPSTTYTYSVRALDIAGNASPLSPSVTAATPAAATVSTAFFSDGFESGTLSLWTNGGLTLENGVGYAGAWAARAQSEGAGASYATELLGNGYAHLYTRAWFKVVRRSTITNLLRFQGLSGNVATLFVGAGGNLMWRNDAYPSNVWSPTVVTAGAWHQVQVRVKVEGPSSQIEVWYDGQRVALLSKTLNLGTANLYRLIIGDNVKGRSYDILYDDVSVSTGPIV